MTAFFLLQPVTHRAIPGEFKSVAPVACDGLSNGHRHIAAAPQAVNEGMGYDFSGYKQLMGDAAGQITEVGGWTHSRRKFHDMHKASQSQMAECAFHAIARRQLS